MLTTVKIRFSTLRVVLTAAALALTLSACGTTNWGLPYKASVQQGNWITSEQVAQLRKGMTREQVRFILGTPTLQDVLHGSRWDYPYLLEPGYGERQERNFTVWFKNDQLDHWKGDPQPDRQPYEKVDTGMTKSTTGDETPSQPSDKEAAQAARQAKHPRLKLQTPNPANDPSAGGGSTPQPLL